MDMEANDDRCSHGDRQLTRREGRYCTKADRLARRR
jgi:hypothetical protein